MEWFRRWFGEEYLLVYNHRTSKKALQEAKSTAALLDIKTGETILDLCCGNGRHSVHFAAMGMKVVGLDYSRSLLNLARGVCGDVVSLVRGDARSMPFRNGSFDVVLNLFTSFGYFTDKENKKLIRDIASILKPEGKFLIDYLNPESTLNNLVPVSVKKIKGHEVVEERKYNRSEQRLEKFIMIKNIKSGKVENFHESVRVYTTDAMVEMIENAGFDLKGLYGDFSGSKYSSGSERMLVYARKAR